MLLGVQYRKMIAGGVSAVVLGWAFPDGSILSHRWGQGTVFLALGTILQ